MKTETLTYNNTVPFAVSFARFSPESAEGYRMLILETDHYSGDEIDLFRQHGAVVLGYLSLGEVDDNRSYFPELQERGFKGSNTNWNSYYLNLQDPETRRILIDSAAAGVMAKGVDGLFLDTIDAVAPYTDRNDMQDEMLELIRSLRKKYPDIWMMQNAGLFLIEETAAYTDAVLIEGTATDYDFASREYRLRSSEEYNSRLSYLQETTQVPGLPVYMLEFSDSAEMKNDIRIRLDSLSYPYFISNIGLSSLPEIKNSTNNPVEYK